MGLWSAQVFEMELFMAIYAMGKADVLLINWNILEIAKPGCEKESAFIGYSVFDGIGRLSTPIQHFDPKTQIGRTESGSTYTLKGKPGMPHEDAMYVLYSFWRKDFADRELFSVDSTGKLSFKYPVK